MGEGEVGEVGEGEGSQLQAKRGQIQRKTEAEAILRGSSRTNSKIRRAIHIHFTNHVKH